MLKLQATTRSRWDAPSFIVRLTTNDRLPLPLRASEALLVNTDQIEADGAGFACIAQFSDTPQIKTHPSALPVLELPPELSYLEPGDILKITPHTGKIRVLYRRQSPSNVLFMTEHCNSNCLMCSQPPRAIEDLHLIDDYRHAIPLMSPDTVELGITGGEPTLLKQQFLDLVQMCRDYLPRTALHILSNGRLLAYLPYAKAISDLAHPDLMIGIPLYADIASIHDYVVQAKGAFDQTIRGILNLARTQVRVELRVVVHRQTYARLPQLAAFIARNLPFVSHVTFMGLEMVGHTRANLADVWIDPVDYQAELETAVQFLARRRFHVSVYNHQLCVLRPSLWSFARQSISDWKNEYFPPCASCSVKHQCGGFFSSATFKFSDHIRPILTAS